LCPQLNGGGGKTNQFGPLERANLNHWTHLRKETDAVSETSCFLFSRTPGMNKVQKPSNSECYTPLSEPFRIYHVDCYQRFAERFCLRLFLPVTGNKLEPLKSPFLTIFYSSCDVKQFCALEKGRICTYSFSRSGTDSNFSPSRRVE
jgi:hypothetical protein